MVVLSHRGYWLTTSEKNTEKAFERSFSLGFGTETDIRDYHGDLVISHDIPEAPCVSLKRFFEIYKECDSGLPLALNIKADGLQKALSKILHHYRIENYFVFDMSVPDTLGYMKMGTKYFTRQSEYEVAPSCYDLAEGVWLDEFHDHWIDETIVASHLQRNKKNCIVSPELHGRTYKKEWDDYRQMEKKLNCELMICTDFPEQARDFFNGEN